MALAIAACRAIGLPDEEIKRGVESFPGLPGRLEYLGEIRGVHVYNDNNATTPDATIAAIRALREKYPSAGIVLIGGGADKELDFTEYAKIVPKEVKQLILFKGPASEKIIQSLRTTNYELRTNVSSMHEAVENAFEVAKEGDIILLSPGAASFGVFKNEYDRNDQFVAEIKKYG
jgi:UDP-N-acetylmuramoylalanine--D-glutamate ligase